MSIFSAKQGKIIDTCYLCSHFLRGNVEHADCPWYPTRPLSTQLDLNFDVERGPTLKGITSTSTSNWSSKQEVVTYRCQCECETSGSEEDS